MNDNTALATGEPKSMRKFQDMHAEASEFDQANKMGRLYAETVLRDLKVNNFPGGLLHRAEEIADPAVKVGFFAYLAEQAMQSLT